MTRKTTFQTFRPGEPLPVDAGKLNAPILALERLFPILPPRVIGDPSGPVKGSEEDPGDDEKTSDEEAEVAEDAEDPTPDEEQLQEVVASDEEWTFISKSTRTERIESDEDPDVYVDLRITTRVVLRKPDGKRVFLYLE